MYVVMREKSRECFEVGECCALFSLPEHDCDIVFLILFVIVNKYSCVVFDGNDYSVPFELAHTGGLVVRATSFHVEVFLCGERVARHEWSYDRGFDVSFAEHERALREKKRRAAR